MSASSRDVDPLRLRDSAPGAGKARWRWTDNVGHGCSRRVCWVSDSREARGRAFLRSLTLQRPQRIWKVQNRIKPRRRPMARRRLTSSRRIAFCRDFGVPHSPSCGAFAPAVLTRCRFRAALSHCRVPMTVLLQIFYCGVYGASSKESRVFEAIPKVSAMFGVDVHGVTHTWAALCANGALLAL